MDSDGFCVSGAVQAAPTAHLASHYKQVESNPALQNNMQNVLQTESGSAPQNRLEVEFRNHLLRIDAENTTLQDTLKAISARTGAEIQFPAGELGERIFVHLGPGSARNVVTQLLNGSQFNYVILSLAEEPGGIARLILSKASPVPGGSTPDAPASPTIDAAANQLYGAGFNVDPDPTAQLAPIQEPGAVAASSATPAASLTHNDGTKLSGEDLDKMQKMLIQQEQQQFAQQLQQQRQQQSQEQPAQSSPPQ
jgi:hypothetical protein